MLCWKSYARVDFAVNCIAFLSLCIDILLEFVLDCFEGKLVFLIYDIYSIKF